MSHTQNQPMQRIADRWRGRQVLVTGSTGFLAKVFVEKMLRCVDTVGGVHLLVRPRADGRAPRQRVVQEVLGSTAFDRLRATLGDRFARLCEEKVHVVAGDLTRERFGLAVDEYQALADRVDVVVNSAATVTFDERLDLALELNTFGPQRLLAFARDAGNVPFLHVSTCYVCGIRRDVVVEDFSAPEQAREALPRDPKTGGFDLDAVVESLRATCTEIVGRYDGENERCRRELIEAGMSAARRSGWNDTYTFTKWLGEQFLVRSRGQVPLAILRPAIIEGGFDEPSPGWIDGMRMADPLLVAYGRGKLKNFPAHPDVPLDLIPVDFVAGAMVAAAPLEARGGDGVPVYHCASSDRNPMLIRQFTGYMHEGFHHRPLTDDDHRPVFPAPLELIDGEDFRKYWERRLARVESAKTWLGRLHIKGELGRKVSMARRSIEQLLYFGQIYTSYTHLDVRFACDATEGLLEKLHPDDARDFAFDVRKLDWAEYIVHRHIPGLRNYVLGAGAEPSARLVAAEGRTALKAGESLRTESLFEAFSNVARVYPDKPALQVLREKKWVRYTYDDALRATGVIMRRLEERGLVAGDRVALCAENGPEWGLTFLALMRAGMTAIPLDPQLRGEDAWASTRFAQGKLMCAGRTTLEKLEQSRGGGDAPLALLADPFVPPPGASRDAGPDAHPISGSELASILFTSGTTVAPKAVQLTHRNFIANARALLERHPLRPTDEFLSVLPIYHAFEFTGGFLAPLACGATITYLDQLKGPEIVAAMQSTGTTVMLVVPRILRMFYDSVLKNVALAGKFKRFLFRASERVSDWTGRRYGRVLFAPIHRQFGGRLRMFVSGGSALDAELFHAFRRWGFPVCEGYGLTETAPVLTVSTLDSARPGSVGTPLCNVELEIRHQNLEGIGEVWVRGPSCTSGYASNKEATDELVVDGWLRTGDLGWQDSVGNLYLTGRAKDLIVTSSGKNVYPDEVEFRYRELPYVKELCVLAMPCSRTHGEAVHAVAVIDPSAAPGLDVSSMEREVRSAAAEVAESLPSHQRITTFHFWHTELPKTSTMKAKRGLIRDMLLSKGAAETRPDAAGGEIQVDLSSPAASCLWGILSRVSRLPKEAIHAHSHLLLDLGIDSIARLEVVSEIEANFRMKISEKESGELARVSDLLARIGSRKPVAGARREPDVFARSVLSNGRTGDLNGGLPPALKPVRWALRGGTIAFMSTYVRVDAHGVENLPATGPFILAPNHSSHLDSPAVVTAIGGRRRVWIAAAEDYFFDTSLKKFLFGKVFDTIPFDRHSDGVAGLRRCAEALHKGDGLLIFPEGTRSQSGSIQPFKVGSAVLATEAGVPIVPVHIARTYDLLRKGQRFVRPGTVRVAFGAPVPPRTLVDPHADRYEAYRAMMEQVEQSVRRMAREALAS
ncbi:MAG: AMP-binding protein [Phycisphaerales bacterium]|nr:AMP-binding protein [Phycisphaerales bacterium]